MKKVALGLGLFAVVAAALTWWLFYESATAKDTFHLDLAEVRALAQQPGPKATSVQYEYVGTLTVPEIGIRAGAPWSSADLKMYAWQLTFPDGALIIDTGMDRKTAEANDVTQFDDAAFQRVLDAMGRARQVVVTHEHYDHLGGLAVHPQREALAGTVFKTTKEQLQDASKRDPLVIDDALAQKLAVLPSAPLVPIAPGVVLIKMPGHTPGMLSVFVQREDGEEFLFISDVSWHRGNWQQVKERARFSTLLMGEDRDAVLAQLAAIKRAAEENPRLHVVPGHDGPLIDELLKAGLVTAGFR